MIWITATLSFAADPSGAVITDLLSRYGADTEGVHFINSAPVELSSSQAHGIALTVMEDNFPLTTFRVVSLGDSLPLVCAESGEYTLRCCWTETLLLDLNASPTPEWLEGIEIVIDPAP